MFAAGKGNGPLNSFSQRKEEIDAKLPEAPRGRSTICGARLGR